MCLLPVWVFRIVTMLELCELSSPRSLQLIVDEFGEKLLEELDYVCVGVIILGYVTMIMCIPLLTLLTLFAQEARNMLDFYGNFKNDPYVKIPMCYRELTGPQVLVMEWIDGVKLTDIASIKSEGMSMISEVRTQLPCDARKPN
eukprot:jgi/Chlat1/4636/Chrsp3S05632